MSKVQVELQQLNPPGTSVTKVGFVKTQFAVRGAQLRIGKTTWRVTAIYATEPDARVAWWFTPTRV